MKINNYITRSFYFYYSISFLLSLFLSILSHVSISFTLFLISFYRPIFLICFYNLRFPCFYLCLHFFLASFSLHFPPFSSLLQCKSLKQASTKQKESLRSCVNHASFWTLGSISNHTKFNRSSIKVCLRYYLRNETRQDMCAQSKSVRISNANGQSYRMLTQQKKELRNTLRLAVH
jgi:hypothetical protein